MTHATPVGLLLATMEPHILAGLKGGIAYFNDGPRAQFGQPFVALGDVEVRLVHGHEVREVLGDVLDPDDRITRHSRRSWFC